MDVQLLNHQYTSPSKGVTMTYSTNRSDMVWTRVSANMTANSHLIDLMQSICIPVICSLGILGNVLTVAVLSQTRLRRSVSDKQEKMVMCAGFISLAIADLCVCACVLPRVSVPDHAVAFSGAPGSAIMPFKLVYQMYSTALITTFSLVSTWLIVLMAAMRYLAICHPLRSRSFSLARGFYLAIGGVYLVALLVSLPSFWMHTINKLPSPDGSTLFILDIGPFSHIHSKGRVYHWFRAVIALFLPVFLLTYFNVGLIRALRASDQLRRHHAIVDRNSRTPCQGGPSRLTITLVAVVVVFILLVFPCEMLDFLTHLTPAISNPDAEAFILARCIANLLQISNFAFNFIIYCVLNVQFRKTLQNMVCRNMACIPQYTMGSRSPMSNSRLMARSFSADSKLVRNNTCTTGTVTVV